MKSFKRLISKPVIGPLVLKYANYKANKEAIAIADQFHQYFSLRIASTPELREEVFRMRHKIYCEEKQFLPKSDDKLERDSFDSHSIHCLVQHRSGSFVGTVRVVMSNSLEEQLPIEAYCEESLRKADIKPWELERRKICELSRIAVTREFRSGKFPKSGSGASLSKAEVRCFPFIALVLYLAAATIGLENDCEHCFVMTYPWIIDSVKFAGINWQRIGPSMEYHGTRAPYHINAAMFRGGMSPPVKTLFCHVNHDLYGKSDGIQRN